MGQIGRLDTRITLQSYTSSADAYGQKIETHSTLATVWAWVKYARGDERIMANRETVVADCIFVIRYRSTVNEKVRIYDGTNYFDIVHIAESTDGRHRYMELTAVRRS